MLGIKVIVWPRRLLGGTLSNSGKCHVREVVSKMLTSLNTARAARARLEHDSPSNEPSPVARCWRVVGGTRGEDAAARRGSEGWEENGRVCVCVCVCVCKRSEGLERTFQFVGCIVCTVRRCGVCVVYVVLCAGVMAYSLVRVHVGRSDGVRNERGYQQREHHGPGSPQITYSNMHFAL